MKKFLTILAFLTIAITSYSQTNLWWMAVPNDGGKIHAEYPAQFYVSGEWVYDSTYYILCAKSSPYHQFTHWNVRYYHMTYGIINKTYYDYCILIDITDPKITEIACHAFFESYIGIDEIETNSILLYPNPFTEVIYFNMNLKEYRVYNYEGKLIDSGYNTSVIDLTDKDPGMYMIQTDKGNFKVIKL